MKLRSLTPIAAVLAMSVTTTTHAEESPFVAQTTTNPTEQSHPEGKCGEGKCGAKHHHKAKKTENSKAKQASKAMKEGMCGEGKCGSNMMKAAPKAKTE